MTQQLTTTNTSLALSDDSRSLVAVRLHPETHPHFVKIDPRIRLASLKAILLNCYKLRHATDLSFIETDATELDKQILKDPQYRELTMTEVSTALTNGACGRYGEVWTMHPDFCLKCLGAFLNENEQAYLEAKRIRQDYINAQDRRKKIEEIKKRLEESKARAEKEREACQQE